MSINEFYENIVKSLDLLVEDGWIKIKNGDKLVNLTHNKIPLVLPTKEHISSLYAEDEDGKIINVKYLFNPLDETILSGDSITLQKLKKHVELILENRIAIAGTLLLKVAENPGHQAKTTMLINQFLMRLKEANNPGIKQVVDDKTIDKWIKLYESSLAGGEVKFLKVYVKKGGKLNNKKYNRTATFKFPIYEELCKLEKGGKINNIPLRNKDVKVFKILFEYLVEGINEKGIVAIGSNDNLAPGFVSLFGLYIKVMTKVQAVLNDITGVDPEWEDAGKIELAVDENDLKNLDRFKNELSKIPRDSDQVKTKLASQQQQPSPVNQPPVQPNYGQQNQQPQQPNYGQGQQPQPQPQTQQGSSDPTKEALKKALYGNQTGIYTPPVGGQPQVVPPQPAMAGQQPAGVGVPPVYQPQPGMMQPGVPNPAMAQQPMAQPGIQQPGYNPQVSIGALGSVGAFGAGAQFGQPAPAYQPNGFWNR